jgi:uncharacterized protein
MLVDKHLVIDTDTHVTEPYDLFTARVSVATWGDKVPHVRWNEDAQEESWYFAGERIASGAGSAMAGWREYNPDKPRRLADVDPAAYDARQRLVRMNEYGIHAQVIYPNIGGFGGGRYLSLGEPELMLACVRAYNDFLIEWCDADRQRLLAQMALPFWDIDAAIKEIDRSARRGHKGIVFCGEPEHFALPALTDPHWDRLWAAAQDHDLPVNFHIGGGDADNYRVMHPSTGKHAASAGNSINFFMVNAKVISQLTCGGICHRFPKLNFVSVESGVGWLPYALEAIDWQWLNCGAHKEHPEYKLLPSEFFRRQIYGSFWFEKGALIKALDLLGPDNIMYETDFPHPTSMSPGPASAAIVPKDYIEATLAELPETTVEKLLHANAARVYRL